MNVKEVVKGLAVALEVVQEVDREVVHEVDLVGVPERQVRHH